MVSRYYPFTGLKYHIPFSLIKQNSVSRTYSALRKYPGLVIMLVPFSDVHTYSHAFPLLVPAQGSCSQRWIRAHSLLGQSCAGT